MNEKVDRKSEVLRKKVDSNEPSSQEPVQGDSPVQDRRALEAGASTDKGSRHEKPLKKRGRPAQRWRIEVVRIDAAKYPQFKNDRDHPFMALSDQARTQEIDSFLARLRARSRKGRTRHEGQDRMAA